MGACCIVFEDRYGYIFRDAVRFRNGELGTYIRFVSREDDTSGVVVLPLHQGNVVLIRHFRHESRDWQLEIPGGFGLAGVASEESALRELEEEIEANVACLVSLGRIHPDTGSGAGAFDLFFAEIQSYGALEKQEGIDELLLVPVSDFEQMMNAGEITSLVALAAYARAKLHGLP